MKEWIQISNKFGSTLSSLVCSFSASSKWLVHFEWWKRCVGVLEDCLYTIKLQKNTGVLEEKDQRNKLHAWSKNRNTWSRLKLKTFSKKKMEATTTLPPAYRVVTGKGCEQTASLVFIRGHVSGHLMNWSVIFIPLTSGLVLKLTSSLCFIISCSTHASPSAGCYFYSADLWQPIMFIGVDRPLQPDTSHYYSADVPGDDVYVH